MTLAVHGIGVSRGIAIGKAHIAHRNQLEITEHTVADDRVEQEIRRFQNAVHEARQGLHAVRERVASNTPAEILEFLDTHVLMLEDGALVDAPAQVIRELSCNAEWALQVQRNRLAAVFDDMEDPYLASRMDDVDQVVARIQRKLMEDSDLVDGSHGPGSYVGIILVADDIAPADLALLHHEGIAALITEFGGPLSHTAILARGLKIPAIMGARHARQLLCEGESVIVEGDRGIVLAQPNAAMEEHYRGRIKKALSIQRNLRRLKDQAARTRDGHDVVLQANVDLPGDLTLISESGADGIGLYRTEYLFLNRGEPPSEEEQFEAYATVAAAMQGRPVTIRTLDLGADKQLDSPHLRGQVPINPAMGLRAIRLCLAELNLFLPQLRAIIRVAQYNPIRILIPMLSTTQELFQVRNLFRATLDELKHVGIEPKYPIQLGGMIEVPAAALASHTFAKHLDFLSIGTNDLIQYTLAIDRIDDQVSYLYDPLHPSVLALIGMVISGAASRNTPLSMCGEMAGDTNFTRLLLAMGMRDLSMQPGHILEVKQVIRETDLEHVKQISQRLLRASNPVRIAALLREMNER